MVNADSINIPTLRNLINAIFDFVEKDLSVDEVKLLHNNYWTVVDDEAYAPEPPTELGVGSLRDDWEFVLTSSKNPDQQLPIAFMHVAPILHALANLLPSYKVVAKPDN